MPRFTQGAGNCLGAPSGGGVHDGHDVIAVEQPKQRGQTLPLALHPHSPEPQVGPIEGAQMQRVAFTKPKAPGNLSSDPGCGAAGQRDRLRRSQPVAHSGKPAVTGPEVVSPFGDAMGLVDDQEPGTNARGLQLQTEALQPFRGDIEQTHRSVLYGGADSALLLLSQRAIETGRGYTPRRGGFDLVLHQGDQGRDDDAQAAEHHGGHLKADGLPAPGGENGESVLPVQNGVDDGCLSRPEVGIAEVMLKQAAGLGHEVHGRNSPLPGEST